MGRRRRERESVCVEEEEEVGHCTHIYILLCFSCILLHIYDILAFQLMNLYNLKK